MSNRAAIDDDQFSAVCRGLAEHAAQVDRDGRFPEASIALLRQSGLLALTVPTRFGGLGGGLEQTARVLGAAAANCASTALIFAMQLFKIAGIARSGTFSEHVIARIMDDAVSAGGLINAVRVEPELGSPTRGGMPATILQRTTNGWSLTGHKIFATGAPGLRWMDVWARFEDQVGHVLVRTDAPGIRIEETWDHIGMRGTCSHDVLFHDTPVEADFVALKQPAAWLRADPAQAAWNAAGIGAIYTGIATGARDWVIHFLRHRVPTGLGAPLATLPRAQEKVGEIEMLLRTNRRLIHSIARETDDGQPTPAAESTLLKAMIIENAIKAVEISESLAGNHAHHRANPIERHIRDVRCGRVQAPQADASFVAAGKAALL